MRQVLIVSPHFPPVNAPDHQRVRMSLPYLREFGWEATMLAVAPGAVQGAVLDPLLEKTLPVDVEIIRVSAVPASLSRRIGLGSIALRALPYLARSGSQLLGARRFDLVYFSTTQFAVMILGPFWKWKFRVPYVLDFQDPWLDDYYERTGTTPPGGKLKHRLSRSLARLLEPQVMRHVSQVISVSPAYVETLLARYPQMRSNQFTVLPFGAAERDFELVKSLTIQQTLFDAKDGKQHWIYIGRGGRDMWPALRLLFSGLAAALRQEPDLRSNLRLHFVGTSYAPVDRAEKSAAPIAAEFGVDELVEERTGRIPYFEALRGLQDADALLVVSSDSPSYSASKLYPYMFARKPLLAVLHRASPLVQVLRQCKGGEVFRFDPNRRDDKSVAEMAQALQRIYIMAQRRIIPEIDEQELQKYSAREMTRQQCEVFDRAVETNPKG
jgi:hypothetical protein